MLTPGFRPQTQKLELQTKQRVPCESTAKRFYLNCNIFHPQTQKLELHAK